MTTGDPYQFFDDTRNTGTTAVGEHDRRGRWMEAVRGDGGTELVPGSGIRGDGHQKVVRSADGKIVIYNYGTINWKRSENCGGIDYRDGNPAHDYRDHIPYARNQRNRNPQTYSVGGDEDYNFGEAQYAQWEQNFLRNMNQGNLNQRYFADRTYPQQYYGPRQPGFGPAQYYDPRQQFYDPRQQFYDPRQQFYQNQNFMPGGVQALNMIARLGMIYALSRGRGNAALALTLGDGGYYGGNPGYYGGWGGNNFVNPAAYQFANNGAYYSGGYVPGTFNQFQGGTQYVPNNAYAWQQATQAAYLYGRQPNFNSPPGFYASLNYQPPGYSYI